MGLCCGIVGLPNVGKSTLFNAVTRSAAAATANYPFCTIDPNVGQVAVPDSRLDCLTELSRSTTKQPEMLELVDIAGLVVGASQGEGLGNRFLGHLREVDALVHLLRCFEGETSHVAGTLDPLRDCAIVETELVLADLETLHRYKERLTKGLRAGEKQARADSVLIDEFEETLDQGQGLARAGLCATARQREFLARLPLLTAKPSFYVANVEEAAAAEGNALSRRVCAWALAAGSEAIVISAAAEAEIALLTEAEERRAFLADLGLEISGLDRLVMAGRRHLNRLTFYTTGPKESRAWALYRGATARTAAGVIHSDMERGFIRAETMSYEDFLACAGDEAVARAQGKIRIEGQDYVVADGDIFHFRFNV